MKVWTVSVFESGDMTTSVWGVYDSKEKAEKRKEELMNGTNLNSDGYYRVANISEHDVN